MNVNILFLILIINGSHTGSQHVPGHGGDAAQSALPQPISGKWVRIGPAGPVSLDFKENGLVEGDFGNDRTVDIVAAYSLQGDTLTLTDREGEMCPDPGIYAITRNKYYLAMDLISDNCGGRIQTTMGFWTRPGFRELLQELDSMISNTPEPDLYLTRARVHMSVGQSGQARSDFDVYLEHHPEDAPVYINRAATRFPDDLKGVVGDCSQAISLDPDSKNAYFLRGLARYELGMEEEACEDFTTAIGLGFTVLRIAEQDRCKAYWNTD